MVKNRTLVLIIFNFLVVVNMSLQVVNEKVYKNLEGNKSQIVINITGVENIFFETYTIKNLETVVVNLNIKKAENFGYAIFQVHSYAYNIKLIKLQKLQLGQNLGIVAFESQLFYIQNPNKFDIDYAIAVTTYNSSSPVSGGCNIEGEISESPILKLTSLKDIIQVDTPSAAMSIKKDPKQKLCSNTSEPSAALSYTGYYYYLPKGDFTNKTYFNGIKRFLLPSNITKVAFRAFKKSNKGPANRRIYMQVPGTGMVFNTIVRDSDGTPAAYVPAVTYFCNPFLWEEGCFFIFNDNALKVLSSILLVVGFVKTFLSFETVTMFIDAVVNLFSLGAFYTYKLIANYDLSIEAKIALVITGGIALTLIFVTISSFWFQITYILYPASMILFSLIFTINAVYIFEGNAIESNTTLYWIIFLFALSSCLFMMIPLLRVLWLILNVIIGGYFMLVGVQFLSKSNLIYIPLKHFYQMGNTDSKYINGYPPSTKTDIYIIVLIVGAIFLGFILRQNKIHIFERRRGLTEEEEPLLRGHDERSSMIGSDEVFESPKPNISNIRL
ncbi:uncharacterized protein LOC129617673 [Condylostylus longicornis]|uniref:uncharacterized protein LOC129617673 n=1 Tax=Condylostylus longicornis TaxID=2530218 RepID=UPI00244DF1B0|nr:uncharacterized protein LOC129617673 [Condylostylus longicornis]